MKAKFITAFRRLGWLDAVLWGQMIVTVILWP